MLPHFLHGMLQHFDVLKKFSPLGFVPDNIFFGKIGVLLPKCCGCAESASFHRIWFHQRLSSWLCIFVWVQATDLGWTSCNLLFLFVNDLRFCRGFVWQWNRRWTIMSVLIKSSVFLFNWIFLWVERTKSLFNSYQNQNCPS